MAKLPSMRTTVSEIYAWRERQAWKKHSPRLGVSSFYGDCLRAVWYKFYWAKLKTFPGRMLRLFDRGHREEPVFIKELEGIGYQVSAKNAMTGKQWGTTWHNGHMVAYADGLVRGVVQAPRKVHLLELKSVNKKRHDKLTKGSVKECEPSYYLQAQALMRGLKLDRTLWLATCKDDDHVYEERIRLDRTYADDVIATGRDIIVDQTPPPRVSNKRTDYRCKFCVYSGICHDDDMPERNCRTCEHSAPIMTGDDGRWRCKARKIELSTEAQRQGCRLYSQREIA